jgi:hypothetical protein
MTIIHKDILIAYANGEQIQRLTVDDLWIDIHTNGCVLFSDSSTYRIKPKTRELYFAYIPSNNSWKNVTYEYGIEQYSYLIMLLWDNEQILPTSMKVINNGT